MALRTFWTERTGFRRGALSVALGLLLWQLLAVLFLKNELIIAPPSSILRAFVTLTGAGQLQRHLLTTLTELFYGFTLAVAAGLLLGYLMGSSRALNDILEPWIAAFYSIPIITIVPILIIWFGVGLLSKVVVIFLIAVVAVMLNTAAGVNTVDRGLLEVAAAFRLTPFQTALKVKLPSALPHVLTGIRLAVGRALLGVTIAELLASTSGLGFLLKETAESYETASLFVAIVLLGAMGVTSFLLIRKFEQWVAPWRRTAEW